VLDRGHEEHRIDLGCQAAVVVGKLDLGVEVTNRPQPTDDEPGTSRPAEVDGQPLERLDVHLRSELRAGQGAADELDAVGGRQQRLLARVLEHSNHDSVEHRRGATDDVDMAIGDRVERARIDGDVHASGGPSRR
jgi:hypothetical protein